MKMYKVGFYFKYSSLQLYTERANRLGEHVEGLRYFQDNLNPMTHQQSMTFISKMCDPVNHFVYEV